METLASNWHQTIVLTKTYVYSATVRSRIGMYDVQVAEGMITQLSISYLELVQTDVYRGSFVAKSHTTVTDFFLRTLKLLG